MAGTKQIKKKYKVLKRNFQYFIFSILQTFVVKYSIETIATSGIVIRR